MEDETKRGLTIPHLPEKMFVKTIRLLSMLLEMLVCSFLLRSNVD